MERFTLARDAPIGRHRLLEVVEGLEDVPALRKRAGGEAHLREHLETTNLEILQFEGYMWVDPDKDGCVVCSRDHWREGDERTVYLDLVHELVHVLQHREGKDLFPEGVDYVDRETEVDAYEVTVAEGRRLGLDDPWLYDYLEVPWVQEPDHARLARKLGVEVPEDA